jgi:GAF domain-containing protein
MPAEDNAAALRALQGVARRIAVARRLEADAEQHLLQSIVDTTATLFDAEASSIALFEPNPDRLEFRVTAGAQGAGAMGLSVPPTQGIVGYVFSTGQPLALSDVASDPRFDRATAERTGYVPRSIAAVPLLDRQGSVGVLQVLDKRGSPTFSLRDMELLAVFARQAATAIRATRPQREGAELLRSVLAGLGPDLSEAQVDSLVSEVASSLDGDDAPLWKLADSVARLRGLTDREVALAAEILGVLARHAERHRRQTRRAGQFA